MDEENESDSKNSEDIPLSQYCSKDLKDTSESLIKEQENERKYLLDSEQSDQSVFFYSDADPTYSQSCERIGCKADVFSACPLCSVLFALFILIN